MIGKNAEDPDYLENEAIPAVLRTLDDPRADDPAAIEAIKAKFFQGIDFSSYEETLPGLYDLTGSAIIKEAVTNFALANAGAVPDSTFLYSFEYVDDTWPSFDSFLVGFPAYKDKKDYNEKLQFSSFLKTAAWTAPCVGCWPP